MYVYWKVDVLENNIFRKKMNGLRHLGYSELHRSGPCSLETSPYVSSGKSIQYTKNIQEEANGIQ